MKKILPKILQTLVLIIASLFTEHSFRIVENIVPTSNTNANPSPPAMRHYENLNGEAVAIKAGAKRQPRPVTPLDVTGRTDTTAIY